MQSLFSAGLMSSLVAGRCEANQRLWAEQQVMGLDTSALPGVILREAEGQRRLCTAGEAELHQGRPAHAGTRCMLALLTGWAGRAEPLQTTEGTIAKHLRPLRAPGVPLSAGCRTRRLSPLRLTPRTAWA